MKEFVYRIELDFNFTNINGKMCPIKNYTVFERINREEFYNIFKAETVNVKIWDSDGGEYTIGDHDYYDFGKISSRDIRLFQVVDEFDKIQNRNDNIDEVLN